MFKPVKPVKPFKPTIYYVRGYWRVKQNYQFKRLTSIERDNLNHVYVWIACFNDSQFHVRQAYLKGRVIVADWPVNPVAWLPER